MTEEVKFIRGNDRINQLAQRPDIADGVTRSAPRWPKPTAPTPWD